MELGAGVIVPPETMEGVGRYAVLTDPTGAAVRAPPERERANRAARATSAMRSKRAPASRQWPISSSSIAIRCPRPITCGCMQYGEHAAVDVRVHEVELRRARSRAPALGGAPPFRYGSKLNWKCTQSSSSKHIGSSQNRASRPRSSGTPRATAVADPRVERPVVVGHQARVVEEAHAPRRARASTGERSAEGERKPSGITPIRSSTRQRALHVAALLLARLPARVDVRVGVVGDLVPGGEDRLGLGRERLDRVAGDEERRLDPCRSSSSRIRGTPTRAPYSPRCSIAGVTRS